MPGLSSQRPFLPPQLMNPMMGGMTFPGAKLPANPNPLAKPAPAHAVKADAAGIQEAMAKRSLDIGELLKNKSVRGALLGGGLGVGGGMLANLTKKKEDRKVSTPLMAGLAGAAGGGLTGALDQGGFKQPSPLERNSQLLKELLNIGPKLPFQGLNKDAAQNNEKPRLSASGEDSGVTFKHDDQGHLTGADAFKTLDGYMKKAGLNSFQRQFFGRLVQQGLDETQIHTAVKTASDHFGPDVAKELQDGLEKVAFGSILKGIGRIGARYVPKMFGQAVQKGIQQGGKKGIQAGVTHGAKRLGRDLTRRATGTVSREGAKHLGFGALHGAANPMTGAHTWMDDEGNFNTQRALGSMGMSMLAGRSGMGRQLMGRGLVGEGAGFTAGLGGNALGHLTGNETLKNLDPITMSRLGYGAGVASKGLPGKGRLANMIPGLAAKAPKGSTLGNLVRTPLAAPYGTKSLLGQSDLVGRGISKLPAAARWMGKNPGQTAMLGGGIATPAIAYGGMKGMQNQQSAAIDSLMQQAAPIMQAAQDVPGQIRGDAQQMMRQKMDEFTPSSVISNLMGGEGGEGGMFGQVGDYMKKNPWLGQLLLPALLGAGGGYALGGGGGAALGGIGLPLIMALTNGNLGNLGNLFNGAGGQGGAEGAAAGGGGNRQPGMENVAAPPPQQQNEIQRQQQQQQGQYGEGFANMQIPGEVQQYASPDELAMLQNPNLPPEQMQAMIQKIMMRGPVDQPGDEQRAISRLYNED